MNKDKLRLTIWLHNVVLIEQNLLIPYDSFSQMSTIYLTCIKIHAVLEFV